MLLKDQFKVGTPLLWYVTEDVPRSAEHIITAAEKPVYRMDVFRGLIEHFEGGETVCTMEDEDGNIIPVKTLGASINYVLDKTNAVLILDHAHLEAKDLIHFFTAMYEKWRNAIASDDVKELPTQLVLLTHDEKVLPEIARIATKIYDELPSKEDIAKIFDDMVSITHQELGKKELVVRAASGLSESEVFNTFHTSLTKTKDLNASFISKEKKERFKKDGTLEVREPTIDFSDIGGMNNAKEIIEASVWIQQNPEEAKRLNLTPMRRFLMVGLPGVGKSALCEATAKALNVDLAKGGISSSMSKWIGESESNMRKMFAQLNAMAPIVFWIDEFGRDASGSQSSGATDGGTTDRVHGEFLTGLQELSNDIFLMAAANRIEDLPPEMLRADRFDKIMFVGFPTLDERKEIFRIHLGAHAENYDLNVLATHTPFFTGAEIKAFIAEVRFHKIKKDHTSGVITKEAATEADFIAYAPKMKNRIWLKSHDWIIDLYKRAQTDWEWASSGQEEEAAQVISSTPNVKTLSSRPTSSTTTKIKNN